MQICMYREVEWHVRLVFWPSACIVCGLRHMKGVVYGVDLIESFPHPLLYLPKVGMGGPRSHGTTQV